MPRSPAPSSTPAGRGSVPPALVFALFLASGATALVYQVAWARRLTLVFGASHEAVGIVLAAFMGGLALGGFGFGRWSDRVKRPLRLYALLELGVALIALALPGLLDLVDGLYVSQARAVDGTPVGLSVLRAALAFGVLLLPTALMGGTLPLLVRQLTTHSDRFGTRLSQLYGINTAGAVAGAAGAGFVLLPALGVSSTEHLAIGINIVIGLVAWSVDRRLGLTTPSAAEQASSTEQAPSLETASRPTDTAWALRLAFGGAAVSGLCALALEVLWMRGLSVAVGTTTYSFTVMLCAFLVGIALGSWLHAALPLRRIGVATQFGVVLAGVGVSSLVVSQLMPHVPRLAVRLQTMLAPAASGLHVTATLATSFAIMLVPCVLMGVAFPLAGEARAAVRQRFGASVGDVVGLNTLGAIAGSVLAGFVLIPMLGLQRGMLLVASLDLAYGVLVLCVARAGRAAALAPLLAAAALALPFVLPAWDVHDLATFRNNTRVELLDDDGQIQWERIVGGAEVIYYAEGRGSNVSVIESGDTRAILIDGKSVASDSLTDMQHELLLGHLPVLLHPEPRTAAVIGLGAGITLGSVLAHTCIESVMLVEIEPAVVPGARHFAHVNGGAVDDPRVQIVFQDGRNQLRTTARSFDVITADPIHPWAHGASSLYTAEYYAIARERLNPGGIMCQWLPLYELSPDNVASVIATFADAYPFASVWQTAYDAVLIGSEQPLDVDVKRLAARLAEPSVTGALAPIGLETPLALLAELALDADGIAAFCEGALRNTDDNLSLEFSSPLSIGTARVLDNIRALDDSRALISAVVADPSPLFPANRPLENALKQMRRAKSATVEVQISLRGLQGAPSAAYAPIITELQALLAETPGYGRASSQLGLAWTRRGTQLLAEGQALEAVESLRQAVAVHPVGADGHHRLGMALQEIGQPEAALPHYETATRLRPGFARALGHHGAALLSLGRFEQALELLQASIDRQPRSTETRHHLALGLLRTGRVAEAQLHFAQVLSDNPELPGLRHNYGVLLVEQGRHAEAVAMFEDGLAAQPDDMRLQRELAWCLATAPHAHLRNGARAEQLARQVHTATGGSVPQVSDALAAALAELGRYEEAVALAEEAARAATRAGLGDVATELATRAELYRAGKPYRGAVGAP